MDVVICYTEERRGISHIIGVVRAAERKFR